MDNKNSDRNRREFDSDGTRQPHNGTHQTEGFQPTQPNTTQSADSIYPGFDPEHSGYTDAYGPMNGGETLNYPPTMYQASAQGTAIGATNRRKNKQTVPLVPALAAGAALLFVGGFTGGAIGYGVGTFNDDTSQIQNGPSGPGGQGGPGMPSRHHGSAQDPSQGTDPGQTGTGVPDQHAPVGGSGAESGLQDSNSNAGATANGEQNNQQSADADKTSGGTLASHVQEPVQSTSSLTIAKVNLSHAARDDREELDF